MSDPRSCDPNEISGAVYVGEIPSGVAGWHFHRASALPGECVRLVREPGNPHDANAIAVHNTHGQRIGFLPRQQSVILAPHVDSLAISLAGRLLDPGEAGYDEELVQTRPLLMISVFMNPAVGSTIPVETALTSGYPRTMLERATYDSNSPGEI
ncbi:MAG TPA: HIRAN domain-containing protein [Isosphaeraceae bacterium]|nr:HIRAN domain-containing protein [Isosphaeraceae bacterium]